tara:strand:- start:12 stop:257 length:246 start_codon:yes stop_codon:yes gene_type:complete
MTQPTTNMTTETYNGWANYETWNVALWIGNDEGLYNMARRCVDYKQFASNVSEFITQTSDGVSWNDPQLDHEELDEMIDEL